MLAAIGSPAEWGAVATAKLFWDDTNGRLGIGGTPGYRLDVIDTAAANGAAKRMFRLTVGADATLGPVQFLFDAYPSATGSQRYGAISVGDSAAWRNLALCPSGGNVGIGTTSPGTKLSVVGIPRYDGGNVAAKAAGLVAGDLYYILNGADAWLGVVV